MAKSKNIPKKETINLAMKEKSPFSPLKLVPALIVIILFATAFGKFAVADLLRGLYELQAQSNDLANEINMYNEGLSEYDKVLDEYTRRSNDWMTDEELSLVDYKTFFPMIEACVLPYSDVESATLKGNDLSLNLINLSLTDASNIIKVMSGREDVVSVSINTANRDSKALTNERTGSAVLNVVLTNGYVPKPVEEVAETPVEE